jgi:hypothetical protein
MSYAPVPDSPLTDTLMSMTASSLERSDLPDREIMIARVAALAAMGAPPLSYTINAGLAMGTGLTIEDAQGILVAVAPVIGTARTGEAAISITEGLGLALALLEAELEEEEEEG